MAQYLFRPLAMERAVFYRFDTVAGSNSPAAGTSLGEVAEARSDFATGALPQFLGPDEVKTLYPKRLTGPRGAVVSVAAALTGYDPTPAGPDALALIVDGGSP